MMPIVLALEHILHHVQLHFDARHRRRHTVDVGVQLSHRIAQFV